MKIESSTPDSYIGSVAGGPQKAAEQRPNVGAEAAAAAGAAARPAAPGVTVSLSASTTQALSGAGSSGGSEVFNTEKVEAMKAAIADGSFKANPEAIADKLLSNAAEMLSAGQRG